MSQQLVINFNKITTVEQLISLLSLKHLSYNNIRIHVILLPFNNITLLLILVAAVKYLVAMGKNVSIDVNDTGIRYLQRINFYRELGIDVDECFSRHNSVGKFIEISRVTEENSLEVVNKILRILFTNMSISDEISGCLNYCFWEMIDNIQEHADSIIGGYTVVQRYPKKGYIEINIVDCGCGIYNSLIKNPKYHDFSEDDAIQYCVQKGYTNGSGMGNGLFHTTNFVKDNCGVFDLYSGNKHLCISNKETILSDISYWQGVILSLKIMMNNPVMLTQIFGDDIPTSVVEYNECINDLW
ncbi:hypothetical protein [Pectinatus frisingensis]|uniref:hypothetical protein n=1 Tax=Pectinatus frisingensis TaxID=865 RepID=UPI0018C7BAC0|nr:hypothetical protein [Pectinatus frisingensis]